MNNIQTKYPLHKLNWIYMWLMMVSMGVTVTVVQTAPVCLFISVFICPGCWVSSLVRCAGGPFDKACGWTLLYLQFSSWRSNWGLLPSLWAAKCFEFDMGSTLCFVLLMHIIRLLVVLEVLLSVWWEYIFSFDKLPSFGLSGQFSANDQK
jgi:hypothetical protein